VSRRLSRAKNDIEHRGLYRDVGPDWRLQSWLRGLRKEGVSAESTSIASPLHSGAFSGFYDRHRILHLRLGKRRTHNRVEKAADEAVPRREWDMNKSRAKLVAAAFLLAIAAVDYVTDVELRVGLFYLVPVVLVAWSVGLRWGVAYACAASAFSVGRGLIGGHPYSHPMYFYYEVTVTLMVLLGASYLVAKFRQSQEALTKLARYDSLTGLANRASFLERLDLELARHRRCERPFSLAILDCDNFKAVNDARGHLEGDRLLQVAAATLRGVLRKTDLACRLGGDEFAVLLPETDADSAIKVIDGVVERLHEAISRGGWVASFSAGVGVYEGIPPTAEAALISADRLMYDVKRAGKCGHKVEVFS
jgi:diguanylate cyclase (GGDEF)-like protein